MALWNKDNVTVTQKGYELLSKLQNGGSTMTITRVVTGSGRVSPSLLYKQIAVSDIKQDMSILKKVASEKGSTLELQVSNENLVEGYNLNQIGVYASNPDLGEILYMIAQSDEPSDFIPLPSGTPTLLNYSLEVVHSKLASINVSISNTGLQPSYDPTLKTTSKIVTEAINEIWDKSNKFFRLFSELPLVGNNDTIYIVYGDVDSKNGQYRWDGTKYDSIASKAQQITSFNYSYTSNFGGESEVNFDIIGYESNQVLIVDLDGVLLDKGSHYTLTGNKVLLQGFTLEKGETVNFLNLRNVSIENLPELMELFNLHIGNKNNPHEVKAEQILMSDGTSVSSAIGQIANDRGYVVTKDLGTLLDLNSVVLNGKYLAVTTILGYTGSYILDITNANPNFLVQKAILIAGDTTKRGRTFTRYLDDGGWSSWREISTIDNISNPNLLINGDFQIWQRRTSFTSFVNSILTYTSDRWYATQAIGTTISVIKDSDNSLKFSQTGVGGSHVAQFIEGDYSNLLGKKVTMSICSKGNGDTVMQVLDYNTGLGGKVVPASTEYIITTLTVILPNSLTKDKLRCLLNFANNQGSINIKWIKLELGEIATPLSPRPYGEELALCQRYYQKLQISNQIRATSLDAHCLFVFINSIVPMRVIPTLFLGVEGVDWYIYKGLSISTSTTGFTCNVTEFNERGFVLAFSKLSHGLTEGGLKITTKTPYVDAEIY